MEKNYLSKPVHFHLASRLLKKQAMFFLQTTQNPVKRTLINIYI